MDEKVKRKRGNVKKILFAVLMCLTVMSLTAISCFAIDIQVNSVPYSWTTNQNAFFKFGQLADGSYEFTAEGAYNLRCFSSANGNSTVPLTASDSTIFTISSGSITSITAGGVDYSGADSYDIQVNATGVAVSVVAYTPPDPMGTILSDVEDTADTALNIGGQIITFMMSNPVALLGVAAWVAVLLVGFITRFFKN